MRSGRPDGAGARRLVATILTCPGLHRTALVVVSGVRACCVADAETSNSNSFRIHRSGAEGSRTPYPSALQRRLQQFTCVHYGPPTCTCRFQSTKITQPDVSRLAEREEV